MRAHHAANLSRNRRDVDDASPTRSAHGGQNSLRDQKRRLEIYVDDLVPIILGDLFNLLRTRDSSIVDQDVHVAKLAFDISDHFRYSRGLGNVALNGDRAPAYFFNFSADLFCEFGP